MSGSSKIVKDQIISILFSVHTRQTLYYGGRGRALRGAVHSTLRQTIEDVQVGNHGEVAGSGGGNGGGGEDQGVGANTATPASRTVKLSDTNMDYIYMYPSYVKYIIRIIFI